MPELFGPEVTQPGTFAATCLLARRISERGMRFVQLFHMGWDQHSSLPRQLPLQARDVDQPTAAHLRDLVQRGLLHETPVVWGASSAAPSAARGADADGLRPGPSSRCCMEVFVRGTRGAMVPSCSVPERRHSGITAVSRPQCVCACV